VPPTLSIVAMSDRQERRRQLTRELKTGVHVRTREVPSLEYCMLLTDRWLASLADHLVKLKFSVLPDCQTVSHHELNYCILCYSDFSCFVCTWCTQVFIPRIFQKELNIRLAGYPPAGIQLVVHNRCRTHSEETQYITWQRGTLWVERSGQLHNKCNINFKITPASSNCATTLPPWNTQAFTKCTHSPITPCLSQQTLQLKLGMNSALTGHFQFAIRIDSIRYANRFESIRFVKKIGLSIH